MLPNKSNDEFGSIFGSSVTAAAAAAAAVLWVIGELCRFVCIGIYALYIGPLLFSKVEEED